MWSAGRKLVLAVLVVSGLVLGLTEVASAQFGNPFPFCLSAPPFGSVFHGTAFGVDNDPITQFNILGRDRVFEERPFDGNAYVTPGTSTVQIGFTYFPSNGNTLTWLFRLNLFTGTGPYNFTSAAGAVTNGTGSFIACPGGSGPIEASGPDPAAE